MTAFEDALRARVRLPARSPLGERLSVAIRHGDDGELLGVTAYARATLELKDAFEREHPRWPGGERGGEFRPKTGASGWQSKLDGPRLSLKGTKKLTQPQVRAAVRKVAEGLIGFYGGDKTAVRASFEPDYLASNETDARFKHPGELLAGLNYGQRIAKRIADPDYGVEPFRVIAHEAAHSLSGNRPGPLPGFAQQFEEGGTEVLSLWYWAKKGQPFDERDATRLPGKWTSDPKDSLAYSTVYRQNVEGLLRRAASRVGWNRTALVDEVERVMRGDHTVRLKFRDQTDPNFALPSDLPAMPRQAGREDETDHAVQLVRWLIQ